MSHSRKRLRQHGLSVGRLPAGAQNSITDVAGVRVGHATIMRGADVRTGVTVVLPHGGNLFQEKVQAAVHTINGFGKACGFEQVRELGTLESPIGLTGTLNVWRVADALASDTVRQNPEIGRRTGSANMVVGECNDGYLNDLQGRHVDAESVFAALDAARNSPDHAPVVEGAVGGGTGMSCYGWKGGIGTASRVMSPQGHTWTVGALVQANFGRPEQLIFAGRPVGGWLRPEQEDTPETTRPEKGSVMVVLATDAPLTSRQLQRLCVRAGAGLARTGSHLDHGSGDFVIAFSTARRIAHRPRALTELAPVLADEERAMGFLFPAVVASVEEAVLNALCMAETTQGRAGHVRYALPVARILAKGLERG